MKTMVLSLKVAFNLKAVSNPKVASSLSLRHPNLKHLNHRVSNPRVAFNLSPKPSLSRMPLSQSRRTVL